jgi:hypothetical protein
MRRDRCRKAFIFTATDDPNVTSFDVVLGKRGSGGGNALVHVHPLAEERFLVTSGRIKVVVDGRPQRSSGHLGRRAKAIRQKTSAEQQLRQLSWVELTQLARISQRV